jgi:hypothetical protein
MLENCPGAFTGFLGVAGVPACLLWNPTVQGKDAHLVSGQWICEPGVGCYDTIFP